jgi:hypothetical protein
MCFKPHWLFYIYRQSTSAAGGAAIARTFLACAMAGGCAMILSGVKKSLLVLSFCFVTFILDKQNKSKTGRVFGKDILITQNRFEPISLIKLNDVVINSILNASLYSMCIKV